MLIRFIALSSPDPPAGARCACVIGATGVIEGAGRLTSGCVCCIFTVAFGSGCGFAPPSGGSVMRAVSFFGVALRWMPGAGAPAGAAPVGGGVGFSGTVGRGAPPTPGGFGAPTPGSGGFGAPPGMPGALGAEGMEGADGGAGGAPGTKGFAPAGGGTDGGGIEPIPVSFVVSFLGATLPGGVGFPGRLIRTVSRFTACCSCLGGSVMRMVSALEASSDSDGAGGISSAIEGESVLVVYLTQPFASQLPYHMQAVIMFRRTVLTPIAHLPCPRQRELSLAR